MMKTYIRHAFQILVPSLLIPLIITLFPLKLLKSPESSIYRFQVLGDFGDLSQNRIFSRYPFELVLQQMNSRAKKNQILKVITLGDNFYAESSEELVYVANKVLSTISDYSELNKANWTLSYGNHEIYFTSDISEFIDKRILNLTSKPGVWSEIIELPEFKIVFFYLPPHVACHGNLNHKVALKQCKRMNIEGNYSEYFQQAEEEFKKHSKAKSIHWRVLVMHYPLFSMSVHGMDNENLKFFLLPLIEKFQIDVVLTGHNHNMQYFTYQKGKKYKQQKIKKKCLKEAKIKCGDAKMNCFSNRVQCPEFNSTCEKRVSLSGNRELDSRGIKFVNFIRGDFVHQVVQGAGGSFLDPFCYRGKSPMASAWFGKAQYGFTEISVSKEKFVIRFFGIKEKEPLFESRIWYKDIYSA